MRGCPLFRLLGCPGAPKSDFGGSGVTARAQQLYLHVFSRAKRICQLLLLHCPHRGAAALSAACMLACLFMRLACDGLNHACVACRRVFLSEVFGCFRPSPRIRAPFCPDGSDAAGSQRYVAYLPSCVLAGRPPLPSTPCPRQRGKGGCVCLHPLVSQAWPHAERNDGCNTTWSASAFTSCVRKNALRQLAPFSVHCFSSLCCAGVSVD